MKTFKLLIILSFLAVLLTACGGKIVNKMSPPDDAPTCRIEAVDRVAQG